MISFPVLLLLINLMLQSVLTEERVSLKLKDPTISADHKTNIKAVLGKIIYQNIRNYLEDVKQILHGSKLDPILFKILHFLLCPSLLFLSRASNLGAIGQRKPEE
uniref:Uncharacterized protein n=1 Tax=Mus spicilegus TaxID=10103 RepID=A0A8C6G4I0_MUSSI